MARWLGVVAGVGLAGGLLLHTNRVESAGSDDEQLEAKVKQLEQRLSVLEGVSFRRVGTTVRLSANSSQIDLESNGNVKIKAGRDLLIESASSMELKGGAQLRARGGGTTMVESQGVLELRGSPTKINGGSKPVARMHDSVVITAGGGKVVAGGVTVLVP